MTILHVFNQPLHILRPYEGYTGTLILPKKVSEAAAERAILVDYRTPRARVLEAIELAYPGIQRENIHVWTLGGKSRAGRLSGLWETWKGLGAHLVEEGWILPTGLPAFTESGTYAPTHSVGSWTDDSGQLHLFLCDGYAASAEAVQAATLAPSLGLEASLSVFTSSFSLPYDREQHVMKLDPDSSDFETRLGELLGLEAGAAPDADTSDSYRAMIEDGRLAGLQLGKATLLADDFFPEKEWQTLALAGYMGPDPYSGHPGVEKVADDSYRVSVRLVSQRVDKRITFTLRFMETEENSRLVFSPLLNRFLSGVDHRSRPVKISDSGRIRNEMQTLCAEALEFPGGNRMRLYLDRIPEAVIPMDRRERLLEVLRWYRVRHPLWFAWLEIVPPGATEPEQATRD